MSLSVLNLDISSAVLLLIGNCLTSLDFYFVKTWIFSHKSFVMVSIQRSN